MPSAQTRLDLLLLKYHDRVYRRAYGMVKDPHLAQDVAQETFLKAYRHLDSVHDERKAGAWLCKIATNAAIDLLRKHKSWNGIPVEDDRLQRMCGAAESSPEEELLSKFRREALLAAVHRLRPDYRNVVLLKIGYGYKDAEIARRLNVSVGTVKSRFHRAKRMIRSAAAPALR